METLLQYLREHQEDTFAMGDRREDSFAGQGEYTKPLRKYVSVFRIDGVPILPPLMTTEKRRQMRILKEKAMIVERRLTQSRLLNKDNDIAMEFPIYSEPSQSSLTHPAGYISPRYQRDYCNAKLNESEESITMLRDIIKRQSGGDIHARCFDSPYKPCSPRSNKKKLKNLQMSEVLIYDNTTNKIIKHTPVVVQEENTFADIQHQLLELERKANLNYVQPQKPSHLLLAGINDRGGVSIPSICLNPPTPLGGTIAMSEDSAYNECSDTLQMNESAAYSLYMPDGGSSDESVNSILTPSDAGTTYRQSRPSGMPRSERIHDLKAYNTNSNVISKIQQFEAINSDHRSGNTSPFSSPDKQTEGITPPTLCSTSLNRSSTSPSIKLSIHQPQTTPEPILNPTPSSLLRSSSFTLETPSKALIDHMRLQNSDMNSPIRKVPSPSRVHCDTVESKAKRVQKVELKSSNPKIQQKTTQQKLTSTTSASVSYTYLSKGPSPSSTHNLYKSKKSPYDTPNCNRSVAQAKKPPNPPVRKSPSSSLSTVPNGQKLNKSKSAATVKQTYLHSTPSPLTNEKRTLGQVDKTQNEKFQYLLKQQEEEQRKLKLEFEVQQKLLIDQFKREVEATHVNADDHTPHAIATSTQRSGQEISGFASDSTQNRKSMAEDNFSSHSNTMSNNINLIHETNMTENPCDQSLLPSLPLSNLSSIDHSNANTSFGASTATVSNQMSDSLPNESNKSLKENGCVRAGSGYTSTPRRRLFLQDYMLPNRRDEVAGSSFSSNHQGLDDLPNCHQKQYQSCTNVKNAYVGVETSAHSRRPISLDDHVVHAAATKINASVRGFLTRRLFKTEQIQRIVQTIHDTLVFVLNLHIETCENPMEANSTTNIKLKARLLQQLASATRTLHLVFFQTSLKERMDIIARDRKRIRMKLLAMKRQRTPRIAG